jgi:hypothetical protein
MSDEQRHADFAQQYAQFIAREADPAYRDPLTTLYKHFRAFTTEHLGAEQSLPYIRFGPTASRLLGDLGEYTGYGAKWEITLNAGLAIHPNHAWILADWPSPGLKRFVRHLLERQLVRQYVWEVEGVDERGHGGFGPRFCSHANRISAQRGRPQVISRRRGPEDQNELLGKFWPHGPELHADPDCYDDDLTQAAIDLAAGTSGSLRVKKAPPSLGLLEVLLFLLNSGRLDRLREVLSSHIQRLQHERLGRRPRNARAERGEADLDGSPLGVVDFDAGWLTWENGIVRKVVEAIVGHLAFAELPILADALEEAGCRDDRILRHLRERMEHTKDCWVLRGLLKAV